MQWIASYPINGEACLPYCGKTVMAVTHSGDTIVGVLDGVRDGNLYFRPFEGEAQAEVRHVKPRGGTRGKRITKEARIQALGAGLGHGLGFGTHGLGNPWGGFVIPLLLLASLFLLPFVY